MGALTPLPPPLLFVILFLALTWRVLQPRRRG
jgi:hypothetical protein